MTTRPLRLLLVDDHPMYRHGLAALLSARPDMQIVAEAGDGAAALVAVREHLPDIVLLDLEMPTTSGLDTLRALKVGSPQVKVLVLTLHAGDEDIASSLRLGANGYLLKTATPEQIVEAIHAVAQGKRHLHPDVVTRFVQRSGEPELTGRELQILRLMVQAKDNRAIAAELGIREGTVKWYASTIFAKLGAADRTAAVLTALRRGIVKLEA